MRTSEVQNLEKVNAFLRAWTRQHNKAGFFMAVPLVASFELAQFIPSVFGNIVMMLGSAIGLTIGVSLIPEDFRSRSGSLTPAICLVTAMWTGALVTAVLSVIEGH